MHPDVLEQNKVMLLQAYEEAKQEGKGEEFQSQFRNIDDFDALLMLPAKEFFILLVTKDRELAPANSLEAMKKAVVDVLGSTRIDDETIQVTLEVAAPIVAGKSHVERETLLLSPYEDEWRVVQ